MLPVVLPLPAADAWDTAPGANLILQTSAGRSFEFVGPLGTHSNVAGIHPKKNLTWLKPFGPSHLRARRLRVGIAGAAMTPWWTNAQSQVAHLLTGYIERLTSVPDDVWLDVALQLCSCCSNDDDVFFVPKARAMHPRHTPSAT